MNSITVFLLVLALAHCQNANLSSLSIPEEALCGWWWAEVPCCWLTINWFCCICLFCCLTCDWYDSIIDCSRESSNLPSQIRKIWLHFIIHFPCSGWDVSLRTDGCKNEVTVIVEFIYSVCTTYCSFANLKSILVGTFELWIDLKVLQVWLPILFWLLLGWTGGGRFCSCFWKLVIRETLPACCWTWWGSWEARWPDDWASWKSCLRTPTSPSCFRGCLLLSLDSVSPNGDTARTAFESGLFLNADDDWLLCWWSRCGSTCQRQVIIQSHKKSCCRQTKKVMYKCRNFDW